MSFLTLAIIWYNGKWVIKIYTNLYARYSGDNILQKDQTYIILKYLVQAEVYEKGNCFLGLKHAREKRTLYGNPNYAPWSIRYPLNYVFSDLGYFNGQLKTLPNSMAFDTPPDSYITIDWYEDLNYCNEPLVSGNPRC